MSTFDNPILEKLAPDLVQFCGDMITSENHCDSNEAFGQTISTLGQLQIFVGIFRQECFCGLIPPFAISLSDREPHPTFMHRNAFSDGDGRPLSIIFLNHLLLGTKHPSASFLEITSLMASIWAAESCGMGPESFDNPASRYEQTSRDIFEFIGIDASDLQLRSANEAASNLKIIQGGRFNRTVKNLLEQDMLIDWLERAYRSGLGLICRFDDEAIIPRNSQH